MYKIFTLHLVSRIGSKRINVHAWLKLIMINQVDCWTLFIFT